MSTFEGLTFNEKITNIFTFDAVRIQKLLEIDPNTRAIVSSGFSDDPVMSDFKKYGFNDALTKPFEIDDLDEKLQSMLASAS